MNSNTIIVYLDAEEIERFKNFQPVHAACSRHTGNFEMRVDITSVSVSAYRNKKGEIVDGLLTIQRYSPKDAEKK
jgi:hypothetical protein